MVLVVFPINNGALGINNPPYISFRRRPVHRGANVSQKLVVKQFFRDSPGLVIPRTRPAPTGQTCTNEALFPQQIR